jgi:hypothetical protein
MNTSRLTALAQSLTAPSTRRDLSRGLAGLTLVGVLTSRTGGDEVEARKHKKRKKHKTKQKDPSTLLPPPPNRCVAMIDGAPCGNAGCLVCLNEVCSPNPQNDGTCGADGAGRCYFGTCNPLPNCSGSDTFCFAEDTICCSGQCMGGACGFAAAGAQCKRAFDCLSGSCIGYRCQ